MGDASCWAAGGLGGVAGAGGAPDGASDATACNAGAFASQCAQCADANCCMQLSTCLASTPCQNLLNCVTGCVGSTMCVRSCDQLYPGGVIAIDMLEFCLGLKCPACSESGVGDPCSGGNNACVVGLTCNGQFCTKTCARSSDCAGIGPKSGNLTGQPNACIITPTGGEICTPGCATNADCVDFPGTYCTSTTLFDRLSVSICMVLPDAG